MGATPVCQITEVGCIRPDFLACLGYVQGAIRSIYGQDVYLGADSQDGQLAALIANAIHDANGETLAVYNAFSPSTAQGVGLSTVVKINGIRRKSSSISTCDFLSIGQVGATVTGGVVRDDNGISWLLPDFQFPPTGQTIVTATCQTIGDVNLPANAVDTANGKGKIATPQLGWQSVTNPSAATPGLPVETDAALRQRQAISTAIPSRSIVEGTQGALAAISGVTQCRVYENDTTTQDANGIPGHMIAAVVVGGDADVIAQVLAAKKGTGVGTYGSTIQTIADTTGTPRQIAFFRPRAVQIQYVVEVRNLPGFTVNVMTSIQQALSDWTNAHGINEDILRTRAFVPANLPSDPLTSTFEILTLKVARDGRIAKEQDIAIAFNEMAACDPSQVIVRPIAGPT